MIVARPTSSREPKMEHEVVIVTWYKYSLDVNELFMRKEAEEPNSA
jgi:hypothetical protein